MGKNFADDLDMDNLDDFDDFNEEPMFERLNSDSENQTFENAFNDYVRENGIYGEDANELRRNAHDSLGTTGSTYWEIRQHIDDTRNRFNP